jgi:hypothetical protein
LSCAYDLEAVRAAHVVADVHLEVRPLNRDIEDWGEVIEGVGRVAAG